MILIPISILNVYEFTDQIHSYFDRYYFDSDIDTKFKPNLTIRI